MGAAFTMLFAKIAAVVKWFGQLGVAVFAAGWDLLCDVPCWVFDQLMQIVVSAVSALDVSGISQYTSYMSMLPAALTEAMAASGAAVCFGIIGSALLIRFVLQLIPFVRLGS